MGRPSSRSLKGGMVGRAIPGKPEGWGDGGSAGITRSAANGFQGGMTACRGRGWYGKVEMSKRGCAPRIVSTPRRTAQPRKSPVNNRF